ncbi:MAG: site-specific DNA-methyltransferase [Candidatus Eisenbacteria bacterium]|nr:site-specific DNA-methyltransferase [Candidatus Eisenbacteria bacterium]
MGQIILGDNLAALPSIEDDSVALIYIDPPFNTGQAQTRRRLRTRRARGEGDRRGFGGHAYETTEIGRMAYADRFDDYLGFLEPRLREARRILSPRGSLFLHLDYREVHYARLLCDQLFGRDALLNEIIWAYDYGGRSRRRWPAKHDNILWYAMDPSDYTFRYEAIDRIPYMAPSLVTPEKAARGKTPTDVWWHTIVPTNSRERTGYPTQKPLGLLRRIVRVHSEPGELLCDFFAGSGTFGEAAAREGRDFVLIDNDPRAAQIMAARLAFAEPECTGFRPEQPKTSQEST